MANEDRCYQCNVPLKPSDPADSGACRSCYEYQDPDEGCPECGDGDWENAQSACIDDMCHGGEVPCMHGDYTTLPCSLCGN